MASLLEIKKKISSTKNMRKITKAMQLVAASKMRHFQTKAISSRDYIYSLLSILNDELHTQTMNSLKEQRESGPTAFILYTSDKGLCGALNNQLMKTLFESKKWLETPEEERILITIGRKARDFAKAKGIKTTKEYVGLAEKFTSIDLLPMVSEVIGLWDELSCKNMYFVAPHYKNSFTFYPLLKQFLPFSEEMITSYIGKYADAESQPERKSNEYTYLEPSEEEVVDALFLQIIQAAFVQSIYELKASEYSSRMIAMQNATDAAKKLIDKQTLTYNKIRQQVITQQISEISNAAEALAD